MIELELGVDRCVRDQNTGDTCSAPLLSQPAQALQGTRHERMSKARPVLMTGVALAS